MFVHEAGDEVFALKRGSPSRGSSTLRPAKPLRTPHEKQADLKSVRFRRQIIDASLRATAYQGTHRTHEVMSMRPALLIFPLLVAGCATTSERMHLPPLATAANVDVSQYLGRWFEVASFPQSFQRGCTATTATYSLRDDGDLDVLNRCRDKVPSGPEREALGRARIANRAEPAKLEVSFFQPFWADYWIVEVGNNYEYAVVGHPSRDYLWILSREPRLPAETYDAIVARLQSAGYETQRLVRTVH